MANKHIGITSLRLLFVGVDIEETFVEVKGQNIIGIIISLSPMMVMVTWYWNEEKHLWKHFLRPSTIFDTVLCVCRYRYVQISFLYKYNKKCAWQYFSLYTIRIYTPYIYMSPTDFIVYPSSTSLCLPMSLTFLSLLFYHQIFIIIFVLHFTVFVPGNFYYYIICLFGESNEGRPT